MSRTIPIRSVADCDATRLLRFNRELLDQALSLVAAHDGPGAPPFATLVGPHLRHVIEHYEALLAPLEPGLIDYDQRARDRSIEQHPHVARQRLWALAQRFDAWADGTGTGDEPICTDETLRQPVRVRGEAGISGEFSIVTDSSLGRELVFLASHTVHHFALLRDHCARHGITTAAHFGVAPATVAHQRNALAAETQLSRKETTCPALALSA